MPDYHTHIGHVHLKVRDLQTSIDFYTAYFDLHLVERLNQQYAFLTGGEMHHEVALQAVGDNAPSGHPFGVGLYHVAFEVPDKTAFAQAYQALHEAGVQPVLVDHLISHAMYFDDPDGNGLEIYVDTRTAAGGQAQWHGQNRRLSRDAVLAHLPGASDD